MDHVGSCQHFKYLSTIVNQVFQNGKVINKHTIELGMRDHTYLVALETLLHPNVEEPMAQGLAT